MVLILPLPEKGRIELVRSRSKRRILRGKALKREPEKN